MAEQKEQADVLQVRMFGNFQLYYGGRPLTEGKMRDTYFTGLLQILLHNISTGVSRNYLEEVLFGDRDVENRHQALQTVVYKAKKKLRTMGLPEENYICQKRGIYYWTPRIPVEEDAALFDESCRQAQACRDEEEKLQHCLKACYQYTGEFLSAYAAVLWAGAEARRYRMLFCECVENAAETLRKKKDWRQLEELGRHAVKTAPFSDWENLVMEALSELGRYDEAAKFYADTLDSYLKEQGVYPSTKFMETMEMMGNRMQHAHEAVEQIRRRLREDGEAASGGYMCSYPVFQGIYRMTVRMAERSGQSVYLMLCRLVDGKGNWMREGRRLSELAERLGEAIRMSVRHGDIINYYGKGQFLILLFNITMEDCSIVEERINGQFLTGRQRIGVQYHVNSVLCEKDYD